MYMTEADRRHWVSEITEEKRSLEAAQRDFKGKSLTYVLAALTLLVGPLFTFVLPGLSLSDMSIAALISVFLWLLYTTVVVALKWKDATGEMRKRRKAIRRTVTERAEVLVRSKILAVAIIYLSGAVLIVELATFQTWTTWFIIPLIALLIAISASFRYLSKHPGTFIDSLIEFTQERPLLSFAFPLAVFAFLIATTLILVAERWIAVQVGERFPILAGFLVVFGFAGIHFLTRWDEVVSKTSFNAAKIREYEELGRLVRSRKLKKQEEVEKRFNRIKDTHPDYTS